MDDVTSAPHPMRKRSKPFIERQACRLMNEQTAAIQVYRQAVETFIKSVRDIDFPLGCPSVHFDVESIIGNVQDTLEFFPSRYFEGKAVDIVGGDAP